MGPSRYTKDIYFGKLAENIDKFKGKNLSMG
jgi:hypothetical protein